MPFYGTYAWSHRNPKINVSLPIFDQTTEIFCKRNVIIGRKFLSDWRKNTHAVLSGHRGLPEAKLFTDLPKLKKETSFHPDQWKDIGVSSRKIQVVLPDEVDSLGIQKAEIS